MRKSILAASAAALLACSSAPTTEESIQRFPIASLEGVLTRDGVAFDTDTSADGNGSLRVEASRNRTVRLFELDQIDAEDTRLIFRARLRSEDVQGKAYLEMWCHFPGEGEYFSRALHDPLTGSTGWTVQETPFFLKKGQRPDRVKLNLVVAGSGTVWIDDVVLAKAS